jgi:hypothetical protein
LPRTCRWAEEKETKVCSRNCAKKQRAFMSCPFVYKKAKYCIREPGTKGFWKKKTRRPFVVSRRNPACRYEARERV